MKTGFYRLLLCFVVLSYATAVDAQQYSIDSLRISLKTQDEDTNKVNTLGALSLTYWQFDNYDSAMKFAKLALSLSNTIGFKRGQANSMLLIGVASGLKRDPAELNFYLKAIEMYRQIGDAQGINECYTGIVAMYIWQGNYPEALKYAYIYLRINEKANNKTAIAQGLGSIGSIYSDQGNIQESLSNYHSSLKILKELGDAEGIAAGYLRVGGAYFAQGNFEEALTKFVEALEIFEGPENKNSFWGVPVTRLQIGSVYEKQGDLLKSNQDHQRASEKYHEALENYLVPEKFYQTLRDKGSVGNYYLQLSNIYRKLGDFTKARKYVEEGLRLFEFIHSTRGLDEGYASLSTLDSLEGNYRHAYLNYRKHQLHHDSLINEENAKKSFMYKIQYESEKKEAIAKASQVKKEAEERSKKNLRNFVMLSLAFLVLAAGAVAYMQWRNSNQRQSANLLLRQQNEKIESTLSNLKLTQSQLIQSEKMASLGELTAGIAHEIQNPLNFVNNFSEVNKELLQEMQDEMNTGNFEEVRSLAKNVIENQEKINHHGKRAEAIVKGMLQHSRKSSGAKEPTDINALADEYLRLAYHGMRAKDKSFNVTLKTDFDQSIGKISIIPQDIGRVILNLITNAFYAVDVKIKRLPDNYEPTVLISTKRNGDKVFIAVTDNGDGVPKEFLDKIFQPFFTTKPTGQGTGLGLSLSYDTIKAHGGEIEVNTTEGEGSEFIIQLPFV